MIMKLVSITVLSFVEEGGEIVAFFLEKLLSGDGYTAFGFAFDRVFWVGRPVGGVVGGGGVIYWCAELETRRFSGFASCGTCVRREQMQCDG
jgi:hypothetical protein